MLNKRGAELMDRKKEFLFKEAINIMFEGKKPEWLSLDFIKKKSKTGLGIGIKKDSSLNIILTGSKEIQKDLIFNTYFFNLDHDNIKNHEETGYLNFQKDLKYYFLGKEYLPKEMNKKRKDRSVRWHNFNHKINIVDKLIRKKYLIIDNIDNFDSDEKEKFFIEEIISQRIKKGFLTFYIFNEKYSHINNLFNNKKYKEDFYFAQNKWFEKLNVDELINYKKEID